MHIKLKLIIFLFLAISVLRAQPTSTIKPDVRLEGIDAKPGSDKFGIKNLNGYKVVFEKTNGEITDCSFIQPNGTFRAKRK